MVILEPLEPEPVVMRWACGVGLEPPDLVPVVGIAWGPVPCGFCRGSITPPVCSWAGYVVSRPALNWGC